MSDTNDVTFDERTLYTNVEVPEESSRATDIAERLVVSGFAKDVASVRKITIIVIIALCVVALLTVLVLQLRGPKAPEEPSEPQGLRVEKLR